MRANGIHGPGSVEAEIAALGPWFHNLHLPGGVQTAPDHFLGDFPRFKWRQIAPHLPDRLDGARVLDIGSNAGFYAFALAERGAEVIGIDTDPRYLRQARWAADLLGADNVRFEQASVYDVTRFAGPFDIILFMGVLYHLRYPLLALDLLARLEPRLMVFQTLTFGGGKVSPFADMETDFTTRERLDEPDWPKMAFIETTFCNDPTNWWVPNHAAVVGMLRSAGFEICAQPGHEIYLCTQKGNDGSALGVEDEVIAGSAAVGRIGFPPV